MTCGFRKRSFLSMAAEGAVLACLCAAVLLILCAVPVSAAEEDIVSLPLEDWRVDTSYFDNSSFEIKDGCVVMENHGGNVFSVLQKIAVRPHTRYRLSAQVRMENYRVTEQGQSGATVLFGGIWDDTCWQNSFVRSSEWGVSSIVFDSGEDSVVRVSLAVGMWGSACEGTAYFKDVTLEELPPEVKDNHWNILALIYRNIDAPGFKKFFSDKEVGELKRTLRNYPDAVRNLSDARMVVDSIDTYVIDTPVRSVSGGDGDFTTGADGDIDFDRYLEGRDYQLIVVYAPLTDSPGYTGWGGLGGSWYEYDGRIIYYLTICLVWDWGGDPFSILGGQYDTDIAALLHEHLHCIETNSSYFNGWDGFTPVHNGSDHGFVTSDTEWLEWYVALMRDEGIDEKGFKTRSFCVPHPMKPDRHADPGDVDADGLVTAKDRMLLARFLRGWDGASEQLASRKAADIDSNGYIEKTDLLILSRSLAGWKADAAFSVSPKGHS